ncbi:MAG: hypothetical protein GC159_10930 [Phycisphaera sp.]|nr:hypothetical protein [Phycisphaera sp.]
MPLGVAVTCPLSKEIHDVPDEQLHAAPDVPGGPQPADGLRHVLAGAGEPRPAARGDRAGAGRDARLDRPLRRPDPHRRRRPTPVPDRRTGGFPRGRGRSVAGQPRGVALH